MDTPDAKISEDIVQSEKSNNPIHILKCVTGWYGDAAKLICGFTSARKKWISKISSCRY